MSATLATILASITSKQGELKSKPESDTDLVRKYLEKKTWKAQENANSTYSLQGLMQYISNKVIKDYWLSVYSDKVQQYFKENSTTGISTL